jgi:outer membrane biosynthesis protein TonB
METVLTKQEESNKRKGIIMSVILHTGLLALFLLPLLTYPDPPPGQEGVLVNLGADFGAGDQNAPEGDVMEEVVEEEVPEETQEEEQEEQEPVESESEPEETSKEEVITTEDPEAIKLKKEKEEADKRKREQEEAERKEREEEAERKRKAAEEAKKLEDAKKKFGDLLGGDNGKGKGDTGKDGNQGDKDGDPNADVLTGISTGAGKVGGGLGSRGVRARPKVKNTTSNYGTVAFKVCVDSKGNVIPSSVEWTQGGSTTTNSNLRSIAKSAIQKWKFSPGTRDRQCGTISYTFAAQ